MRSQGFACRQGDHPRLRRRHQLSHGSHFPVRIDIRCHKCNGGALSHTVTCNEGFSYKIWPISFVAKRFDLTKILVRSRIENYSHPLNFVYLSKKAVKEVEHMNRQTEDKKIMNTRYAVASSLYTYQAYT